MKKGKYRAVRVLGLGLALALLTLLSSAVGAGVEPPAGRIALGLTPGIPAAGPLVTGDVLRLDVTAAADFAARSSGTVIYYDSNYFSPCDAAGNPFTAQLQGGGVEGYLVLNPDHPLCRAGPAFGEVNATNRDGYAALALYVPYDLAARPVTGVPAASMPWFTFYLKVTAPTPPGKTASVFMPPNALRSVENRAAPMYYSAGAGGVGWLNVEVALPARLDYAAEAPVPNPVRVNFTAGAHGRLTGGDTYMRNVEAGTALAEQSARHWPAAVADFGYFHAGWAYADDPAQSILPGDTPLGAAAGDVINLVAVFRPDPLWVEPYVEGGASRSLQYRSSVTLRMITGAPGDVAWSSSDPGVASVSPNTGEVKGAGRGTATITGRDGGGFEARVSVTVDYAWWQWLIVIVLFGWIWY